MKGIKIISIFLSLIMPIAAYADLYTDDGRINKHSNEYKNLQRENQYEQEREDYLESSKHHPGYFEQNYQMTSYLVFLERLTILEDPLLENEQIRELKHWNNVVKNHIYCANYNIALKTIEEDVGFVDPLPVSLSSAELKKKFSAEFQHEFAANYQEMLRLKGLAVEGASKRMSMKRYGSNCYIKADKNTKNSLNH